MDIEDTAGNGIDDTASLAIADTSPSGGGSPLTSWWAWNQFGTPLDHGARN